MTHWLASASRKIVANDSLRVGCFERTGMLLKLNPGPDDEKVKPQGLKLPYTIPTQVEAFPPAVPVERESESSIDSNESDSIEDSAGASDFVVDDEDNEILSAVLACAGVSVDQALLYLLYEKVVSKIVSS